MSTFIEILPFLMFAAAFAALLRGYPVAFTLAGVALLFALIGMALDVFDPIHFRAFPQRIYGNLMEMDRQILVAVPLFVFMGVMLEKSKVAEELLEAMGALFGTMRGWLGISVVVVGALLAATAGVGTPPPVDGEGGEGFSRIVGTIAIILASVNIFGGFLVTQRMLAMYKKKEKA